MNTTPLSFHYRRWLPLFCVLFAGLLLAGCGSPGAERLLIQNTQDATEEAPSQEEPGQESPYTEPSPTAAPSADPQEALIYVDVSGAVLRPGVYSLPEGSRVFLAIDAAGGMTADAAGSHINKALPLTDGQQVYVPSLDEVQDTVIVAQDAAPQPGTSAATPSQDTDSLININTADEALLTRISGIGPTRAQAIIAYRESNGPFACIEDVQKVNGIKGGIYEKIKEQIKVN